MKAIWAGLRDENKLSMGYETFRAHCRGGVLRLDPALSTCSKRRLGDSVAAGGRAGRPQLMNGAARLVVNHGVFAGGASGISKP